MDQPGEMVFAMILSGKSPSEVEAELRRKTNGASWDKAIAEVQDLQL
jgi:hypothetical protein